MTRPVLAIKRSLFCNGGCATRYMVWLAVDISDEKAGVYVCIRCSRG